MKKTLFLVILSVVVMMSSAALVTAQKRKKTPQPQPEELRTPPLTPSADCKPSYQSATVWILRDGVISIDGNRVERANLAKEITKYVCGKSPDNQNVSIAAPADTQFSQITAIIKEGRKAGVDDYVLMIHDFDALRDPTRFLKIVEQAPAPSTQKVKAHRTALDAALLADGKIELNGKPETLESLTKRLEQIFETREKQGVFFPGSREVEKTVFIYAAPTVKLVDLINLIKTIEKNGAKPVGLDIDDFYPRLIFR